MSPIKEKFEHNLTHLSTGLKSMGHPARISILLYLMANGDCNCQDIVDQLPYSQSTVSGHLQKLKEGKLIAMKTLGTSSIYSIEVNNIESIHAAFGEIFNIKSDKKQLSLF